MGIGGSGSSSSSSSDPHSRNTLTSFALASNNLLKISVTDPQKHGEGSGAYVTYLVSSNALLENYTSSSLSVRRRFQDFVWLHRTTSEEFPACILPPLPGKHRMEYITGDRFSTEFIEKRRAALQTYLERFARHPTLRGGEALRRFLESSDLGPSRASLTPPTTTTTDPYSSTSTTTTTTTPGSFPTSNSTSNLKTQDKDPAGSKTTPLFENLSDALLNAFSKVKKPDEKFVEFREMIDKFEENLSGVERLHAKLIKYQNDLEQDMIELAGCINTLGVMETQITTPLTDLGNTVRNVCSVMKEKTQHEEQDYLNSIREYISYCQSVKDVLKLRDQKQVDFEELSSYLQTHMAEQERTMNPTLHKATFTSFLKDKMQELRGEDKEKARISKLGRLQDKITE
ncbi:intercellular trafficking and secretion, partial [Quaeritorhiza haematococci]